MIWWIVLIVIGLVVVVRNARKSWRGLIRREYISYLKEVAPEIELIRESEASLVLKIGSSEEINNNLYNLYGMCSQVKTIAERRDIFGQLLSSLREASRQDEITLATHRDRIMPRLMPDDLLPQYTGQVEMPYTKLEGIGLSVLYVLDYPNSVAYISQQQMRAFDLDLAALHEIAMSNLEKTFPREQLEQTLHNGTINVLKLHDSYDAARILVLPRCLADNVRVVAHIPDRDTLALLPATGTEANDYLRKLKVPSIGRPLLKNPVLVSNQGFELLKQKTVLGGRS